LIKIPTWSGKVLYNAGTRIYYNNNYQFPDRLEIDGPTNMTLQIVVGNFIVPCVQIYNGRDGVRMDGVWVSGSGICRVCENSVYMCSYLRDLLCAAATLFTKRV